MRNILKAFTKTVSGTAVSLLIGTLSVKIIASIIGCAGIGLYSILRQIQTTTLIEATMSGQTALVQGGAKRKGKDRDIYPLLLHIATVTIQIDAALCEQDA